MEEEKKAPKLLLSFVLDNSTALSKEQLEQLMLAFRAFETSMAAHSATELELIVFDTFTPRVAKAFEGGETARVPRGKMPLLSRSIELCAARIRARIAALNAEGVPYYRPWMFVLSGGLTLEPTEKAALLIDSAERAGEFLCLPFLLSADMCDNLKDLERIKHMICVDEAHYTDLFAFVCRMVERREATDLGTGVKFDRSDFEGWAVV